MKISLEWLSDFISWKERDSQAIAAKLTASTGEVEEVEEQGGNLAKCCVGKIVKLQKHPNADRLSLADVQTDQGMKRVVCGGTNLREGMIVAFAHVGATVRGAAKGGETFTIERMKFRGEDSDGMICAAEELGLTERFPPKPHEGARPVIDFASFSFVPGTSLREALGMNDVVLHIDNHALTHRPDLFSHVGFARECVALGLAVWKKTKTAKLPAFPKTPLPFKVILEQKHLLPRYLGCSITIAAQGETPLWMKRRLEALGGRSLSLPIDITNYVMLEYGVPLHSFDLDDLKGDIRIRASMEGEIITTLDEVKRTLPAGAVVIHDDLGIFDLLPIMGGLRSSTKPSTKHIYLQSVSADPVAVRAGVIGTGLRTEAATVSEKGIPPVRVREAFNRALELFLTLVPGATITSKLVEWGKDGSPKKIPFSTKDAERVLGVKIPGKTTKSILEDLGFKTTKTAVVPPLWRVEDVTGVHDVIEEVGRIFGFNQIEPKLPESTVEPPPRDPRFHQLRDSLKEEGFDEIVPLSLLGPELLAACRLPAGAAREVENALGEELSLMQTSTLPRLLEHAGRNMLLVEDSLKTFGCAHVFSKAQGEWTECGICIAERKGSTLARTPFLAVKQVILDLLRGSGYAATFSRGKTPPFGHPGRSLDLFVEGKPVGLLFEVHPSVARTFSLPGRAAVCLLDLSTLLSFPAKTAAYNPISQFPAVVYDLTVTLDASRSAEELLKKIRSSSALLEDVNVADLYDGLPLSSGQYNLTLRCTYRSKDRTLTEEEVKKEHQRIEGLLAAK